MTIPFIKAHGAGNDFLLSWAERVPAGDLPSMARAICNRHTGVGADGWILIRDTAIRLFNADGSEAEISGNGTRCAAAVLIDSGRAAGQVTIVTGAGPKHLSLIERRGGHFVFEMDMGRPQVSDGQMRFQLPLKNGMREVTILDVGNPQCAVFVEQIPADWQTLGAEIEAHPQFPKRTNVSFVRVVDPHTIEVRFFERGAGATLSSGTGSTGAAVAAILRQVAISPVRVLTEGGESLQLRWDDSVYLTGPAEIVAAGEFFSDRDAERVF
ncbi:MAG TPA: diaminopimelate epimerase [Bryobacteraceae bacterium]|nr:diaminopimelate epimerase [Bryobacteraceae bacterium]